MNLYGANSGNDLAGKGDASVAALFRQDFPEMGMQLGAQVLATNVGSNGAAFGVANKTTPTLMDLLLSIDDQAVMGLLSNGTMAKRGEANAVYSAFN